MTKQKTHDLYQVLTFQFYDLTSKYNIELEEILCKYEKVDGDLNDLKQVLYLESVYENLTDYQRQLYKSLIWKDDESQIFEEEFHELINFRDILNG